MRNLLQRWLGYDDLMYQFLQTQIEISKLTHRIIVLDSRISPIASGLGRLEGDATALCHQEGKL